MDPGRPVVGVVVEIVVEDYTIVSILAAVVVEVAENSVAGDTNIGCLIALICCIDRGHGIRID